MKGAPARQLSRDRLSCLGAAFLLSATLIATPTSLRAEETPATADGDAQGKLSSTEHAKRTGYARAVSIRKTARSTLAISLEDPRGFLPVPIVVAEPAVGYGGGAVGMFLRPRREAGEEGWARPDISALGGFGTENGTWGAFGGDASR